MVQTTKTLNPLPFHSLEPKRFEDLIRGLIYDFKKWRQLEATGRSGGDDGFDIRGWEIVELEEPEVEEPEEETEEQAPVYTKDRLWLIQGKREKDITPKKMEKYLDDIFKDNKGTLHGVIFAAACDYSLKTRNIFRSRMIKEKIQEFQIWSGGELEDMMYQPKNDNLLFAFFGISLSIKRRGLANKIKSKITIKAKAKKVLGSFTNPAYKNLLVRDFEDDKYPFMKSIPNFKKKPKWYIVQFEGHYYKGIMVKYRVNHAYIADDGKHFDYTRYVNNVYYDATPWESSEKKFTKERQILEFLKNVPDKNKATLEMIGYIPYENIVAIDADGDSLLEIPHVYVQYDEQGYAFTGVDAEFSQINGPGTRKEVVFKNPPLEDQVNFFPKKFPKLPSPKPLESEVTLSGKITKEDIIKSVEEKPSSEFENLDKKDK